MLETQVVIIGGGIMGTMLARELSQYNVDVILLEKKADVSMGISKSSNGFIYSPSNLSWLVSVFLKRIAELTEGTMVSREAELMKERLCLEGAKQWDNLLSELDVKYITPPQLITATTEDDLRLLKIMEDEAKTCSYNYRRLNKLDVLSLEPNLNKDIVAALYDDTGDYKVVYPWEIVMALAEVARQNGIKIMLNTEVTGFSKNSGFQVVETTNGQVKTEFVINATGADGAHVAAMAGACDFGLQYFKGHLIIGDKNLGKLLKSQVSSVPRPGIMKLVYPLPSDNLMVGLIYTPTHERHAIGADRADLEEVFNRGRSLLPALTTKDVVSFFAMSRVYSARDPDEYIVEYAPNNPRFINTLLRMPGFIPAPAIAKNIVGMLVDHGLPLTGKRNFKPCRKAIPRFNELSSEKKKEMIARDPRYGHVVCRCETVTEGEVVEAIKRGATTVDGIKFRTRAGMGRCQGGFCGTRVIEILARELNIDPAEVTKHGGHSRILLYRGKELLEAGKKYARG